MKDKLFLDIRDPSYIKKIMPLGQVINGEAPLPCALICAAYVDKVLKGMVETVFIKSKTADKLMKDDVGLLGSLFARARILYLMGYITTDLFENSQKIGQIRNLFAHSHEPLTFESPEIKQLCEQLKHWSNISIDKGGIARATPAEATHLKHLKDKPRLMFTTASLTTVVHLMSISLSLPVKD